MELMKEILYYILWANFVIPFVPTILVVKRLNNQGTSSKIRKRVRNQHMVYFICFYIEIMILLYRIGFQPKDKYILDLTQFLVCIDGILLAIVRINEPYVYQQMKKALCRKSKSSKKVKYSDNSMLSFLNSAMNIELVYFILVGINKFQR